MYLDENKISNNSPSYFVSKKDIKDKKPPVLNRERTLTYSLKLKNLPK
jgi:hypothetical protein